MTGSMPKNGRVAEPGFNGVAPGIGVIRMPPVSVCHQVSTIGQRCVADMVVIPQPRLGVDRLADRAEQAQRLAAGLADIVLALAHQRPDRGRRGVEDRDIVLVDDLPEARRVRVVRHALEHQGRRAVGERAVDDVAVPGDPADIGGAPVNLAVAVVEDVFVRHRRVDQIAAGRVQHALRLAGRSRGVEDEQRVLGRHLLGRAVGRGGGADLVIPEVAAVLPNRCRRRCAGRR